MSRRLFSPRGKAPDTSQIGALKPAGKEPPVLDPRVDAALRRPDNLKEGQVWATKGTWSAVLAPEEFECLIDGKMGRRNGSEYLNENPANPGVFCCKGCGQEVFLMSDYHPLLTQQEVYPCFKKAIENAVEKEFGDDVQLVKIKCGKCLGFVGKTRIYGFAADGGVSKVTMSTAASLKVVRLKNKGQEEAILLKYNPDAKLSGIKSPRRGVMSPGGGRAASASGRINSPQSPTGAGPAITATSPRQSSYHLQPGTTIRSPRASSTNIVTIIPGPNGEVPAEVMQKALTSPRVSSVNVGSLATAASAPEAPGGGAALSPTGEMLAGLTLTSPTHAGTSPTLATAASAPAIAVSPVVVHPPQNPVSPRGAAPVSHLSSGAIHPPQVHAPTSPRGAPPVIHPPSSPRGAPPVIHPPSSPRGAPPGGLPPSSPKGGAPVIHPPSNPLIIKSPRGKPPQVHSGSGATEHAADATTAAGSPTSPRRADTKNLA